MKEGKKMNKKKLAKIIAKANGITITKSKDIIETYETTVMEAVAKGEMVRFVGFGTFRPLNKKAMNCRNPQTGEAIVAPAKRVPKFTAGKTFKAIVNK